MSRPKVTSRLRVRLAAMIEKALLEDFNIEASVDPDDLDPATGWYRTSPHADVHPWEGRGRYKTLNLDIVLEGGSTMTKIVKSGKVTLSPDRVLSGTCFAVYDATGN